MKPWSCLYSTSVRRPLFLLHLCPFSYHKMLERAGYSPAKHLVHITKMQEKEGADSIKLGAVSGQQYKEIFKARAFDRYFFQIPPKKR